MKKTIFSIMLAATLAGAVAIGWQINQDQGTLSDTMLANIEALSYIEVVDGKIIIVDEIPCSSSAVEVEIWESYVNCVDCKSQKGHANGLTGTCTRVTIQDM